MIEICQITYIDELSDLKLFYKLELIERILQEYVLYFKTAIQDYFQAIRKDDKI